MTHAQKADQWHKKGYNCAQSVVGSFADLYDTDVAQVMDLAGGFGFGAGNGELCGAIAGGIMALGLTHKVDPSDPVGSKQRTLRLSREFQKRFEARFGYLRCQDLLAHPTQEESAVIVRAPGRKYHCDLMVASAAALVEEMLQEEGLI